MYFPRMYRCGNFLSCLALAGCVFAGSANATTILISGSILQSTQDGTGPAVNNPSLNAIHDNDLYSLTLIFGGGISTPGLYNLTGSSFLFNDTAASATENAFNLISLTVTANGSFDDISMLGCLTTGSGCLVGNQLTANFRILAASLNSMNVMATGLDQFHPLDLLEDDGLTDIHGSITGYSYISTGPTVPEPATGALVISALAMLAGRRLAWTRTLLNLTSKKEERRR